MSGDARPEGGEAVKPLPKDFFLHEVTGPDDAPVLWVMARFERTMPSEAS